MGSVESQSARRLLSTGDSTQSANPGEPIPSIAMSNCLFSIETLIGAPTRRDGDQGPVWPGRSAPWEFLALGLNHVKAARRALGHQAGQEAGMNLQEAREILGAPRRHEVKRLAAQLAALQRQTALEKRRLAAARLILRHK